MSQPAVLIGIPHRATGLSCVDLDFHGAGAMPVESLADLGHRTLGLIGPPPSVYQRGVGFARRLLEGFESAAQRRGVRALHAGCDASPAGVGAAVAELFQRDPAVTGLVVHNEGVMPHLRAACAAAGRRIPEDLAVVSICPDDMADSGGLAYTNIHVPTQALGEISVDMVMGLLDGAQVAQTRLLVPVLTRRETSTPPSEGSDAAR